MSKPILPVMALVRVRADVKAEDLVVSHSPEGSWTLRTTESNSAERKGKGA